MNARLLRKEAWTVSAVVEAGVPEAVAPQAVVDGSRAVPMRARESVSGRRRTAPTTRYVWGPDLAFILGIDGGTR